MKLDSNRSNVYSFGSVIILTLGLLVGMPLLLGVKDFSLFLGYASAFSGIATLIVAFIIYDKLDSKKLAFNKRADAVDVLFASLNSIHFTFILCNQKQLYSPNMMIMDKSGFYLNWHNIHINSNTRLSKHKVYFSPGIINRINSMKEMLHNPWIPKSIGQKLLPIFVYSDAKSVHLDDDLEAFILVKDHPEDLVTIEKIYLTSYDSMSIVDYEALIDSFKLLLTSIESWYESNFDEKPDFQGDFKIK